ncbi:ATP-dependent DNA helicase PIF1-like isoform X3 [Syngnathus typhle]|uniref:ATP-dependent DNA helicase PIF1-like isoform X3 n=1 Tax=Syngnathus typhle TaxID=161592 RepID=UPI002A69B91F|nr:ATP-dependent DNA helicase PIF1-like isoform X3 [Syngnathus typhle]XP_061136584.1 ATP-dependent DNA helicase PIF1-like isoform X3 [Syngnathus typhle]
MHSKSHSKSCVKHQGANCRFGFPKQPCDETMIVRPAPVDDDNRDQRNEDRLASNAKLVPVLNLLNEPETASLTLPQLLAKCKLTGDEYMNCLRMTASSSSVVLKREPKDCWVNNYNRHLLLTWDGNLDIQYIVNAYSCIAYICSYISKAEHGLSQYLKSVIENSRCANVNENVEENVPDYNVRSKTTQMSIVTEPAAIDPAVLRDMYRNLNQKQASVFYKVRDWCIKRVCSSKPIEQFFYHINGGAGTGKSHLIKCIHAEATKILQRLPRLAEEADISKQTVVLAAFTGTAAFNISGATLHCLLKLPRSLKPPYHGLGNKLDEVRAELSIAEILIIDEISMVSKDLFAYVNARLKQIKGINLPFGGMSVLAVGDFFQLPPVRQSKPLCVYDPTRPDHWRDDFKKITLTAIMRQKDDVAFAELLNRLRVKEKSDELSEMDRALLATRTLCRLTRMTTRKTKELAEWQGLCNGMFAKVVKLVNYPNEARVQKLGLELDHVSNTARAANPVYIDRLEEKLNKAGVTRRQFPIKLAFACTIHKVQGMTTSQAAVSLKGVFEHGMGYVALSRVTSLSGLHILHMDERRLHANPQITAALAEMAEDSLESVMPLLRVMPSVDRANHLVVVHHNTEGLSCHVQDIVSHHELLFADVLCFTETHLQGSVADGRACLEGYMMFCRNRSDSYTNCPDLATKRGGGVGICVKSHIVAQEKKYVQGVTDIEFVVVMLGSPVFE